MKNIKVAIADDHNLFREGIAMIISGMPDVTLCAEASDGAELLNKLEKTPVDVVLLDLEMKKMGGIETLQEIRARHPDVKVIILSMHTEPGMVAHLMRLGANGYLIKDTKKQELETAIREVWERSSL